MTAAFRKWHGVIQGSSGEALDDEDWGKILDAPSEAFPPHAFGKTLEDEAAGSGRPRETEVLRRLRQDDRSLSPGKSRHFRHPWVWRT